MLLTQTTLLSAAAGIAAALGSQNYDDGYQSQQVHPSLRDAQKGIYVPFVRGSEGMDSRTPQIRITLPGLPQPIAVDMDTGSCGFTLSYADMKQWYRDLPRVERPEDVPEDQKGSLFLSSSKLLKEGIWVPMDVDLVDTPGLTRSRFKVLAITRQSICPEFSEKENRCPEGSAINIVDFPKGIRYLGVGFGREGDGMEQSMPDKNLLLNMIKINDEDVDRSRHNPGYIVDSNGIHIGLDGDNTAGFNWQKLQKRSELPMDWSMATMSVMVQNPVGEAKSQNLFVEGNLLVDTGIPQMYLTLPTGYGVKTHAVENISNKGATSQNLEQGCVFNMDMGGAGKWKFTQGAGNPTEPQGSYTMYQSPSVHPPFVNTGRHFLKPDREGHDIAFDAKNGWFGVRNH